jgi:hypothetical protein
VEQDKSQCKDGVYPGDEGVKVSELNNFQVWLLDNGIWLLPLGGAISLAVFPWSDWNALFTRVDTKE